MKENASRDYWNKDDLRVYVLLYCANADLILKEEEQAYITEKMNSSNFSAIEQEYSNDNDYQSIKKIQESINHLGYDENQLDNLIAEIKELFWVDGEFDNMERAILRHLEHILRK